MPLFQQLFRSLPSWSPEDDRWYSTPFHVYGDPSIAGPVVTNESALALSTVHACVRILSDSVASLPVYVYERQADGGRRRASERIADRILTRRPNGEMSPFRYKQVVMAHLTTWGNHYSFVERDDRGIRTALWPIYPAKIEPRRNMRTNEMEYVYRPQQGSEKVFTPYEIFHVPGFGLSGLVGRSPIALARQAVGLGLAAEEFGSRFFGSGTHAGVVIRHPGGGVKPETMQNLKDAIREQVTGLGKSHNLLVLFDGMEAKNITIPPEDAQFLETRQFQIQEICRFYRMPPHMVADLARATFSNIEHQGIEFVVHTLGPWLSLLENEFSKFFLTAEERKYFYFEFLIDKFLRGDIKSRYAAYQIARNAGWLNADEIRAKENMNPMQDGLGKIYTVQAGVQSLSWLTGEPGDGEGGEGSPAPTPFTLVKMLRVLTASIVGLREKINTDTRGALRGGLANLEERMTKVMSLHAESFNGQLVKAASVIEAAFTRVVAFQGEERVKEATALMVAVKGIKKDLAGFQKRNAAEQQQMWEALGTLPGISDSVDLLRVAITDSSTVLQGQIDEVKSSATSTSGKLSRKMSHELRELNDLSVEVRTRLDDGLTQLSESTTIEDAVSELRTVVTATQEGITKKIGKISLDTDPIVAALTKSQEEVDAQFTAVEDAIKAGITPKMLQGVVQEKFSEGLAGILHRLDSVETRLTGIVPEDVIKSIVEGGSRVVRDLIEERGGQEPVDLSPLESAIKDLGIQVVEDRQEPVDLTPLEEAIKDLGGQFSDIRKQVQEGVRTPEPVDMEPVRSAIKSLGTRIAESRQEPVDLAPLEGAIKALNTQIAEARQEPIDLTPLEGAVKDLGAQLGEVQNQVRESRGQTPKPLKPIDLTPMEGAIKDLGAQSGELHSAMMDTTSNQANLVASISKIVDAQTQMVAALNELRADGTDHGKMWTAKSEELGVLLTSLFEEIKVGLEGLATSVEKLGAASASKQTDQDKRMIELEKRVTTRVVANREKVNSQYLPLIQDTLQFILNRECIAVRRALKKFTGKREEMVRWLDDFYGGHYDIIEVKFFRLFSSFFEALYTEVAIEGGLAGSDIPDGFDDFVREHFKGYVERHMETSYGYLKGVAGNEDQTATNDMVDTWHNKRAGKVAIEELGRAGEAIVAFVEESHGDKGS